MAKLTMGEAPEGLEIIYTPGDPYAFALYYREGPTSPQSAWPGIPSLVFVGGSAPWVATLSESGRLATWSIDADRVAIVDAMGDKSVRLRVNDRTWFSGQAIARG